MSSAVLRQNFLRRMPLDRLRLDRLPLDRVPREALVHMGEGVTLGMMYATWLCLCVGQVMWMFLLSGLLWGSVCGLAIYFGRDLIVAAVAELTRPAAPAMDFSTFEEELELEEPMLAEEPAPAPVVPQTTRARLPIRRGATATTTATEQPAAAPVAQEQEQPAEIMG